MTEEIKIAAGFMCTILLSVWRVIWVNNKSIAEIKAETCSREEVDRKINDCHSDVKEDMVQINRNFEYIRDRLDKAIEDREKRR